MQSSGATELLKLVPKEYYEMGIVAYNESLRVCFMVWCIVACLSILGALGMGWRSVNGVKDAEVKKGGVKAGETSREEKNRVLNV